MSLRCRWTLKGAAATLTLPSRRSSRGEGKGEGQRMRGPAMETTKRARRLRQSDNDAEAALWLELRDRRLNGYKFVRQFPTGRYFADFACRQGPLVVEIDGCQHADRKSDQTRDRFMVSNGWSVLRFWNFDVLKSQEEVLETILAAVEGRLDRSIETHELRFIAAQGYGCHVFDRWRRPSPSPSPVKNGERGTSAFTVCHTEWKLVEQRA